MNKDATNIPAIARQRIRIDFFKGIPPFSAALSAGEDTPTLFMLQQNREKRHCFLGISNTFHIDRVYAIISAEPIFLGTVSRFYTF